MTKIPFLLIAGLCTSLSVSAQEDVFRSIGEDGTVEFSDQGGGKSSTKFQVSKQVVVPGLSEIPNPNDYLEAQRREPGPAPKLPSNNTYEELQILSPANNEGGWIDGDVQVKLALSPELKPGHEVVIELNGKEVTAGAQLNHELPEVHRGLHTLQVSVRDTVSGSTLTSDTVSFQVHRRSDKSNTRMLHPSLQTQTIANPSDVNEILSR